MNVGLFGFNCFFTVKGMIPLSSRRSLAVCYNQTHKMLSCELAGRGVILPGNGQVPLHDL